MRSHLRLSVLFLAVMANACGEDADAKPSSAPDASLDAARPASDAGDHHAASQGASAQPSGDASAQPSDAGRQPPVVCEEGAAVDHVEWQRIEEGLDDFLFRIGIYTNEAHAGNAGFTGVAFGNGVWLATGSAAVRRR